MSSSISGDSSRIVSSDTSRSTSSEVNPPHKKSKIRFEVIEPDQKPSELFAKIILVVSLILLLVPCGLVMLNGAFPYAVTCLCVGGLLFLISTYLLCKK